MLHKIRLELARCKEFPEGAHDIGYEFSAPLTEAGHIDADAFRQHKDRCRVVRFRRGEEDDVGHLIRKPGGSWAFHYDIHSDGEDDESGYRFADHVFQMGEYVSIREDDALLPYQVKRVLQVA
jgi:hypothetical protein